MHGPRMGDSQFADRPTSTTERSPLARGIVCRGGHRPIQVLDANAKGKGEGLQVRACLQPALAHPTPAPRGIARRDGRTEAAASHGIFGGAPMPRLRAAGLCAVTGRHSCCRGAPLWLHPQSGAPLQEATTPGRLCSRTRRRGPCRVRPMPPCCAPHRQSRLVRRVVRTCAAWGTAARLYPSVFVAQRTQVPRLGAGLRTSLPEPANACPNNPPDQAHAIGIETYRPVLWQIHHKLHRALAGDVLRVVELYREGISGRLKAIDHAAAQASAARRPRICLVTGGAPAEAARRARRHTLRAEAQAQVMLQARQERIRVLLERV